MFNSTIVTTAYLPLLVSFEIRSHKSAKYSTTIPATMGDGTSSIDSRITFEGLELQDSFTRLLYSWTTLECRSRLCETCSLVFSSYNNFVMRLDVVSYPKEFCLLSLYLTLLSQRLLQWHLNTFITAYYLFVKILIIRSNG